MMRGLFCLRVLFVALCLASAKADIAQTSITTGAYTTTGTATVSSGFIQLTSPSASQAGVALYSTQQTMANGFSATFDYVSSSCSSPGADGFTFLVSPTLTIANSLASGNALAIVGATNVAVVAFDLFNDKLYVCSTNAVTPLSWSSSCVFTSIGTDLRCSNSHTLDITFSPPSSWQVWLDGSLKGSFTKDIPNTLTMVNNMTYIGFTGATGPSYNMRQRITSWTFMSSGTPESPIAAPVAVPVAQPIAEPPVEAPVFVEPPVEVPVAQPVAVPVAVPVSVPVSTPVAAPQSTPVATPVATPVTPPQAAPVAPPVTPPIKPPVNPPVSTPTTMPVIIPILECFDDLQNGTFIAYFGYNNTMGQQVSLPVGSQNTFGSPSFIGQPTSFAAGRSEFFPNAAFAYLWNGNSLTWTLTSFRLTLDTSDTSRKCPSFARFTLTFYTERQLNEQEVNAISSGVANALGISPERVRVLSIKYTPVTSRKRDLSVAELEMEIAAANSTQQNEPSAAQAVQTLVETAQNTTALAQALDPTGTSNIQPIGVKSAPTGVEQSGNAVPPTDNEPSSKSPRGLVGELISGASSVTGFGLLALFVIFMTMAVSV